MPSSTPIGPGRPVRAKRRCRDRLPGRRRRADRPRLHSWDARRSARGLGHAALRRSHRGALDVRPGTPLRQARKRAFGSGPAGAHAGDEDGRHPRCDGRGRLGARRALGGPGGDADRPPLRRHVPGAHDRSRPLRPDGSWPLGAGLPVGPDRGCLAKGAARNPRSLGRPRVSRRACAPLEPVRRTERGLARLVRLVHATQRQPGRGGCVSTDVDGGRRPRRPRRRSGADARSAPPGSAG